MATKYVILFSENNPLKMNCGAQLTPVTVAYETYGELNADGSNAVLVCHALTGNAHASDYLENQNGSNAFEEVSEGFHLSDPFFPLHEEHGWWNGVIGKGKTFDPEKYFIVCSNFLGSCYGTTGPASINPATGQPFNMSFPQMTTRDMVRVQHELLRHLGVNRLVTVAGGSLGGMQVLEWPLLYPDMVKSIIPIATAARHSAWSIGLNEAGRLSIINDPAWKNGNYAEPPAKGLALARAIAMISYRSQVSFEKRFGRQLLDHDETIRSGNTFEDIPISFQVENYLRYQGEKLVNRFDANSYIYITRAMDLHDVTEDRGSLKDVLGAIAAKTLCVGISSDVLYPPHEQQEIAALIPDSRYEEIDSIHGHDAFLIEFEQMNRLITDFLQHDRLDFPNVKVRKSAPQVVV